MFTSEILSRALITVEIILIGISIYSLYNFYLRHHIFTNKRLSELGPIRPKTYVLLYSTTPTCVMCRTVQRPAIEKLSSNLGDLLQVVEIDATVQPEMAKRWGVLSVPTTFLINPRGEVTHINHGVARIEKLLMQLHF